MSGKKRHIDIEGTKKDSDNINVSDNEEPPFIEEEIQVAFEGRSPTDSDYHGIKQLLQQVFLKAHINLAELTELIISQNSVGSVVKQSICEEDDDDDDEDDDDPNDVFAITSVVNLTEKKDVECVAQLRALLKDLSQQHATERCQNMIHSLLSDDARHLGLLINERFINIPVQISVPLLGSLKEEIKKAVEKKQPFDFAYYVIICKLFKTEGGRNTGGKKGKLGSSGEEIVWSNPEEEIIDKEADWRFEFSVKEESDTGLTGSWLEGDHPMTPYRRVIFLSADKLNIVWDNIKSTIAVE